MPATGTEPLRIPAKRGGAFDAWMAAPASGRGPGLIVLAEIYNANWYEGADHGFDRDGYPPYHPEASALARRRTLDFLRQHLGDKAS